MQILKRCPVFTAINFNDFCLYSISKHLVLSKLVDKVSLLVEKICLFLLKMISKKSSHVDNPLKSEQIFFATVLTPLYDFLENNSNNSFFIHSFH